MPKAPEERSVSVGYSFPRWMHEQIAEEARRRGIPASMLLNQAWRFWLKVHGDSTFMPHGKDKEAS